MHIYDIILLVFGMHNASVLRNNSAMRQVFVLHKWRTNDAIQVWAVNILFGCGIHVLHIFESNDTGLIFQNVDAFDLLGLVHHSGRN